MISDQLLLVLKLCLLALLYLFFFRVVRAVWTEIRPTAPVPTGGPARTPADAPPKRRRGEERSGPRTRELVVVEPIEAAGRSFPLIGELSIGRAAGCQITLDDTYASQIHARVFSRDGQWQVEDLGSTNGTWLNRHKVAGSMVMKPGDVLQVGNTVMELR